LESDGVEHDDGDDHEFGGVGIERAVVEDLGEQ
jgi:hypothetical protein